MAKLSKRSLQMKKAWETRRANLEKKASEGDVSIKHASTKVDFSDADTLKKLLAYVKIAKKMNDLSFLSSKGYQDAEASVLKSAGLKGSDLSLDSLFE